MKTRYENFTKKERYIEALKGEYFQEYPEFTFEQIRRPIYLAVSWFDGDINEFRNPDEVLQMFVIDQYREILRDREDTDENGLDQSVLGALCFLTKAEDVVRYDVSECCKIPFPEEHKEKYLEFISKMTERVVRDMCDTLEKRISHAGKVEYWNWIEKDHKSVDSQNSEESFVEKFSGKKRSLSGDAPQSFTEKFKSKKVSFDDNAKKSDGVQFSIK